MAKRKGNSWGGLAQVGGTAPAGNSWGGNANVGGTGPAIGSNQTPVHNSGPGGAWSPTPPPPPQPIDPAFEMQKAAAGRNLTVGNLGAAYQGAQIGNEYGFGTDKSNPYSQAKLLEESWKRSKLGTTNNYASSGQLHSGAYGRMQGENDRNYSIGVDRGTRDMNSALGGVALGQLQNSADYGVGLSGGDFEALINAFRNKFGG